MSNDQQQNLREWVQTVVDVFVEPLGVEASDDAIDTLTEVVECRADEIARDKLADTISTLKADKAAAEGTLAQIRTAVLGLRTGHGDHQCWCGVSVGLGDQHADYCLAVQSVLLGEGSRSIPPAISPEAQGPVSDAPSQHDGELQIE
jgi:hypothetical protein